MTSPTLRIARRLRRTWRTRPPRVAGSALRNSTPRSAGSTRKASREPDRGLPRDGVTQPCPYPRCDKDLFTLTRRAISGLADQPYPEGAVAWGATGVYRLHAGDIRILGRGRHQGHEGQRSVIKQARPRLSRGATLVRPDPRRRLALRPARGTPWPRQVPGHSSTPNAKRSSMSSARSPADSGRRRPCAPTAPQPCWTCLARGWPRSVRAARGARSGRLTSGLLGHAAVAQARHQARPRGRRPRRATRSRRVPRGAGRGGRGGGPARRRATGRDRDIRALARGVRVATARAARAHGPGRRAVDRLAEARSPDPHRHDRARGARGGAAHRPGGQQGLRHRRDLVRPSPGDPAGTAGRRLLTRWRPRSRGGLGPGVPGVRSAEQAPAVEDAEFLPVQLHVHAVRVAEVHTLLDAAVRAKVLHTGLVEPLLRGVELLRGDGDGQVLDPADGLAERRVLVAGEVEEPEHVAVADVKEEVAGTRVVAVLHQFHQREAKELLVEQDRLLDVLADQGEMVDALHGAGGPLTPAAQVFLAQLLPARPDLLEILALRRWHGSPPWVIAAGVRSPGIVRGVPQAQGIWAGSGAPQPGCPGCPGSGAARLCGDAAAAVQHPLHTKAPPAKRPAVQAAAFLGEDGGRHGQDRALRVRHAVPAHPAAGRPGHHAAPAGAHDEQVAGPGGEGDQHRAGLAALHDRLDGQIVRNEAPGGVERVPKPLPRGLVPDADQGGTRLPGGEFAAGRDPGQNRRQGGTTVAGQVLCVAQRAEAARRAARADDDPTYAGHGSAPSSRVELVAR